MAPAPHPTLRAPRGNISGPAVSIPLVIRGALAGWVAVICMSGAVRSGGILGR